VSIQDNTNTSTDRWGYTSNVNGDTSANEKVDVDEESKKKVYMDMYIYGHSFVYFK
jgi:hypothetical protein